MSTFITRLDPADGTGPRLAVKDLIDVRGVPTTAGSRAVERIATPAARDAACLAAARAAGARIVGKTNLHELAMLPIGTNPWFGTPVNPLDAACCQRDQPQLRAPGGRARRLAAARAVSRRAPLPGPRPAGRGGIGRAVPGIDLCYVNPQGVDGLGELSGARGSSGACGEFSSS